MAHLDLEEQEQLDQLKHFWQQYGNLITWVLTGVMAAYAGWNLYQYWQRDQAVQAAAMYDEVERIAAQKDPARLERALADMKDKFGATSYAMQAGLLAAKVYGDAGKVDDAKTALTWVAEKSPDEGYQAIARLRLAALQIDAKEFDAALKQLSATFPAEFVALAADRRGDLYLAQGKKTEAAAEYRKAYLAMDVQADYRRLVDAKLASLGVAAQADAAPAGEKK